KQEKYQSGDSRRTPDPPDFGRNFKTRAAGWYRKLTPLTRRSRIVCSIASLLQLALDEFQHPIDGALGAADLAADVGDGTPQQAPEAIPVVQLIGLFGLPCEEAPEHGLHHVLGVHLLTQQGMEMAAGQADEPVCEAMEDEGRGRLVAVPQSGHEISKGICLGN